MINNHPVTHEFDDHADLVSVIDYVSGWASERGLVFNEVIIDEKNYMINELPDLKISGIENINCILYSVADLLMSSLEEGINYCEKSVEFLKNINLDSEADLNSMKDMAGGYEWMAEIADNSLALLNISGDTPCGEKTVSEWIGEIRDSREKLIAVAEGEKSDSGNIERAIEILNVFWVIFRMIFNSSEMRELIAGSVDSPESLLKILHGVRTDLESELNALEEAAIAFQTGRDLEGMEKLNQFIEFIFNYNRACYQAAAIFSINLSDVEIEGVSMEEKNRTLLEHLSSLVQVMENSDIIGLSDILEYEIKPFLGDLDLYIDELLKRTTS